MAGLKALVLWFPAERLALANGCYIMLGALGAVTATLPAEVLLDRLGWRGLFAMLAAATLASAALLWFAVPSDPSTAVTGDTSRPRVRDVYLDRRFWRIAPLSACCIGTAFALQGLWAGPWLADVARLERSAVVSNLFAMALGLSCGALSLGIAADRLRRRGVRARDMLVVVATGSMLVQLALILQLSVSPGGLWTLIGIVASGTVLSYAALADAFPKELAGRANAALNVLHIGGAFIVQRGIGLVVGQWSLDSEGHYPAAAYAVALGLNLLPQATSLVWFLLCPLLPTARNTRAGVVVEKTSGADGVA
jgi:predicted MFS family arabinose efflux permease